MKILGLKPVSSGDFVSQCNGEPREFGVSRLVLGFRPLCIPDILWWHNVSSSDPENSGLYRELLAGKSTCRRTLEVTTGTIKIEVTNF